MSNRRTHVDRSLQALLEELEVRVRLLERRLKPVQALPKAQKARVKPARRCAGCLQDLPKGKRGPTCVWCGFRFDVVAPLRPAKVGGRLR